MIYNEQENPLDSQFDDLLEIAKEFDVTLSLGDGLRPGCLADATDRSQVQELILLGELAARARESPGRWTGPDCPLEKRTKRIAKMAKRDLWFQRKGGGS